LQWKDPKSGAMKSAYTPEFLQRNADKKWERIGTLSSEAVGKIKQQSNKLIKNGKTESAKAAGAIIYIISETGLRRGDKAKFEITGNRGVSTLAPENVIIKGNRVSFNFTGKSYQENTASVNNAELAKYLTQLKQDRAGEKFLFPTSDGTIDTTFDSVGGAGLKLKDLRTYVATDTAKKILFDDPGEPPPLPTDISITKKKKLIKDKLAKCYELVSQKLNNTPAMAKSAYVHPLVVTKWLESIGANFEITKGIVQLSDITLDQLIKQFPVKKNIGKLDEASEEMCDIYPDLLQKYE
jgi:DNA topoisomerase I